MTPTICPTITASDSSQYLAQLSRVSPFARRLHIDLCDGSFAPVLTVPADKVWWPGGVRADLHVMFQKPLEIIDILRALGPQLVIVHAEASGDFALIAETLHHHGIETGVALLPETPVEAISGALSMIDHVLIFSGNLGHQGGSSVDLSLLDKVASLRTLKPTLEIGWDGGVNETNVQQLALGGIDVINSGGFIQHAPLPQNAFNRLKSIVEGGE